MGTWGKEVDAFILLSEFQRNRMTRAGLPAERTYVKPHFYPGAPATVDWSKRNDCVVFVGRLSVEKGIESLVRTWMLWGEHAPILKIIGGGPLLERTQRFVATQATARIAILGHIPAAEAEAESAKSKWLILPSECFEGFPMVIRDAFAFGTPVAASDIGPLPEIVADGISGTLFNAGNPTSILKAVRDVWTTPGALERLSKGARCAFEKFYTASANYQALAAIYEAAITRQQARPIAQ
jgi:glycosyltransferase involved in cell wall biosynthesis